MRTYKTWILCKLPSTQVLKVEKNNLAIVTLCYSDIDNIEKSIDEKQWLKLYPINFDDIEVIKIDHLRNLLIIEHKKETEQPDYISPIEDVKTKDDINNYFQENLNDVKIKEINHTPTTALYGPGLVLLIWGIFCWLLYNVAIGLENGEEVRAIGLKKHILAGLAELLGPIGIIVLFIIILIPIFLVAYARYKNPPIESKFKFYNGANIVIK
jgi:hypothetical protein